MNRGPATRRPHKRCKLETCGAWFRPKSHYDRQQFCSRPCAAAARPRQSRVDAGRKGGTARGEHFRQIGRQQIRDRVAAMTPLEAFLDGCLYAKRLRSNRIQSAKREGFSDGYQAGYDAALQDRRREHSA